jgi:D-alanyl-D-alanine carboxypeptidase (penicillin-binding protein 5/6)
MEKIMSFSYLVVFLFVFSTTLFADLDAALDVKVGCTSAVLVNSKTGKVLFEKNASQPMYPASCTKIAFALYAIKFHEPIFKKRISASQNALKTLPEAQKSKNNFTAHPSYVLESDASHMGLKVGEEMTFYDLLEATMVVSADDASNVIAEVMGNGSIDRCVSEVNRYMQSLGLSSTRFTNPHGLHHPDHVTTAHDLAKLSVEAIKYPHFQKMAKMPRFSRPKTNKQASVQLQSTNRLLVKGTGAYYGPAVGIKTGYHRRAGHCLVAQAEKNDRSLIAVILQGANRDERFNDAKKLFQAAFDEKKITKTYLAAGNQSITTEVDGATTPLHTFTTEAIFHSFYPSDEPKTRCELVWGDLVVPIQQGAVVGELLFYADDEMAKKVTLFAATDVEESLTHVISRCMGPWAIVSLALIVGCLFAFLRRRGR